MRMSRLLVRTLRDPPADAEVDSHRLLVRAGYVARLASGVWTYLPLGERVLANVNRIVREELDAAGAQEMLMPALQPVELWRQSGRDRKFGEALPAFLVAGRGGEFVLGPTHEEVVTATVSAVAQSWRDLPVTVYQIQAKFRDEARPRFGLMRTRELLMADAYSFDADAGSMAASYRAMFAAYEGIFRRLGIDAVPVEAAAGAIGGDVNHEFMVPSEIGEDRFASCGACAYAANVEAVRARPLEAGTEVAGDAARLPEVTVHDTPGEGTIDEVVAQLAPALAGLTAHAMLKCFVMRDAGGTLVAGLVPGDRDVVVPPGWASLDAVEMDGVPWLERGFIGPMGLAGHGVRIVADPRVAEAPAGGWVTGANEPDRHVSGIVQGRDFQVDEWRTLASVADGDPCPDCGGPLRLVRAVEAAHTFQLGLTYSSVMAGASFLDAEGRERPYWMGCYGIGLSRIVAVLAEAHHDEAGLSWPVAVAPYPVQLLALGRDPSVREAADALYATLGDEGVDVLYDDRGASAGVSFADADLLGMPLQVIVGAKGLATGIVECKWRADGRRETLPVEGAARHVARELLR